MRVVPDLGDNRVVNRHLNVFTRYSRPDHHEDQLTRAAMIVLRLVPAAREALLRLIDGPGLSVLSAPGEVDMQTAEVLAANADDVEISELVSVFLVPDERAAEDAPVEVVNAPRGQRLDGVIRFGSDLVVVLEAKVVLGASDWQARNVDYGRAEFERTRQVRLEWHRLLDAWRRLADHDVLAPAERLLIQDLLDYGDEHHAWLMPFTTLRRARGDDDRVARRLRSLIREATGLQPSDNARTVMLDQQIGTHSVQRAELAVTPTQLWLEMWPGESNAQARHLYASGRARRLLELSRDDGWTVVANPFLSYRNAHYSNRLYTSPTLTTDEYVRCFERDGLNWIGQYEVDGLRTEAWPWLLETQLAADDDDLDAFVARLGRRPAYLRAGIAIRRSWQLDEAEQLDEDGRLAADIRESLTAVLDRLDEPALPPSVS